MSRVILLGSPGTKRAVYLEKGAAAAGVELEILDWRDFPGCLTELARAGERIFLKIDPPRWGSCCLKELERLTREYGQNLDRLSELGRTGRITFLNDPAVIKALLDKRDCKRLLAKAGIPVTEEVAVGREMAAGAMIGGETAAQGTTGGETAAGAMIGGETVAQGTTGREAAAGGMTGREAAAGGMTDRKADGGAASLFERLLETMERERVFQVFLKPNKGSGAAGVMALRYEPGRGQMVLYTCAAKDPETGRLVNTKRLRRFGDRQEIGFMAGQILAGDCIVERWYPKAETGGYSYDLRAVVLAGEPAFILARLSKGPITNLQLNNHPGNIEELGLCGEVWDRVKTVCRQAAGCFSGLGSVGIDILLEKGSLRPRVIEMNGQGDLIYQDIYGENQIYERQGEMMRAWRDQERSQ